MNYRLTDHSAHTRHTLLSYMYVRHWYMCTGSSMLNVCTLDSTLRSEEQIQTNAHVISMDAWNARMIKCKMLTSTYSANLWSQQKSPCTNEKRNISPTPMPLVSRLVTSADYRSDVTGSRSSLWRCITNMNIKF